LETFLQTRLRQCSSTTVAKERETVAKFFLWTVQHGYLTVSPATGLPRIKEQGNRPPFRTLHEIDEILQRGGLDTKAKLALWDSLFLAPTEIACLLELVRQRSTNPLSFLLHALPAYTGMRRGELLRLRWSDLNFAQSWLTARSHKQSRQIAETSRRIDPHPEFQAVLSTWRDQRTKGQFVLCRQNSLEPPTPVQANHLLWQPMRGTSWCLSSRQDQFKIGFHTYRHSFASKLPENGPRRTWWSRCCSTWARPNVRRWLPCRRRTELRPAGLGRWGSACTCKG
jgi:integrase